MRLTIRAAKNSASGRDALSRLGAIDIETPVLAFQNVDGGVSKTVLTVAGERYLVTNLDVRQHGHEELHVTLEVAPAAESRRDFSPDERRPEC